jgi:hypothetical protein
MKKKSMKNQWFAEKSANHFFLVLKTTKKPSGNDEKAALREWLHDHKTV